MNRRRGGFTLVELLIVIVVIAILAAISVVAYGGIQQRARDSRRDHDMKVLTQALEMFYIDNGHYPIITAKVQGLGSGAISSQPFTVTWDELAGQLEPYLKKLPVDPLNRNNPNNRYTYNSYQNNRDWPILCDNSAPYQSYSIEHAYETSQPKQTMSGGCSNDKQPWWPLGSENRYFGIHP